MTTHLESPDRNGSNCGILYGAEGPEDEITEAGYIYLVDCPKCITVKLDPDPEPNYYAEPTDLVKAYRETMAVHSRKDGGIVLFTAKANAHLIVAALNAYEGE